MLNLVKKDFLTISKSRSDLIELLFMPLILIVILGFALGNVLLSGGGIETFSVGVINDQSFENDITRLEERFNEENYPEEVTAELMTLAEEINPTTMIMDMLNHEDFEDLLIVEEYSDEATATEAVEAEEITGYITFTEDFNLALWENMLLGDETPATIQADVLSEDSVYSNILLNVLTNFVEEYNLESSIAIATEGEAVATATGNDYGEVTNLSVEEPINSFQYYTIGMGVMFALYTAPAIASRAFAEKDQNVYGRIMLAGTKPMIYLGSKMISTTVITFIQLLILFSISSLLFGTFSGRDMDFWLNLLSISGIYALLVGSLGSLLTSITLYANNLSTANFFGSFIAVFAFLGGSFTSVSQFSEALKALGNWTPNGAAMTSYLQLLQGFSFQEFFPLVARLIGMFIIFLILSIVIFPRRRLA
jgi:ABC-2 type transport system permease protein